MKRSDVRDEKVPRDRYGHPFGSKMMPDLGLTHDADAPSARLRTGIRTETDGELLMWCEVHNTQKEPEGEVCAYGKLRTGEDDPLLSPCRFVVAHLRKQSYDRGQA